MNLLKGHYQKKDLSGKFYYGIKKNKNSEEGGKKSG